MYVRCMRRNEGGGIAMTGDKAGIERVGRGVEGEGVQCVSVF